MEAEVVRIRASLEKGLDNNAGEQEIEDKLRALESVGMTLELLRSTKVGVTVAAARKKFPESVVGNLARDMINKWKELVPAKASSSSSSSSSSSLSSEAAASKITAINTKPAPSASSQESSSTSEKAASDPRYDALTASRKKIVDLLAEKLKLSCTDNNSAVADFMACSIESGINSLFDSESDKANYASKVRSLMFNLKSNEALRHNIIAGVIATEDVAHLTPAQLASEEKIKEAEKALADAVAERRGDWVKISRDQLMRDNGLDPTKGGEFTCKKCKGTKTSHYAMQTRSADEPMTVFVCCLTCGNRWRTQ